MQCLAVHTQGLLAAAQSSGGGPSSSPSDGGGARRGSTPCVCGFQLVAEATRERRLDHRSSWSRTLRLAVLVGFITLAFVGHAAVVALHAVLVVEIGMLRKRQPPAPFPSATLPTTTESYDIELRGRLETHGADTGPPSGSQRPFGRRSSGGPSGRSEDPRPNRCAASTTATTDVAAGRPPRRTRRGRSRHRRRRTVAGGVVPEAAMAGNVQVRNFDAPRALGVPVPGRPASSTGSRTLPTDP